MLDIDKQYQNNTVTHFKKHLTKLPEFVSNRYAINEVHCLKLQQLHVLFIPVSSTVVIDRWRW